MVEGSLLPMSSRSARRRPTPGLPDRSLEDRAGQPPRSRPSRNRTWEPEHAQGRHLDALSPALGAAVREIPRSRTSWRWVADKLLGMTVTVVYLRTRALYIADVKPSALEFKQVRGAVRPPSPVTWNLSPVTYLT